MTVCVPVANSAKSALVDDEDAEPVRALTWWLHESCYARGAGGVYMHRLIMGLKRGDGLQVDHINGDGLDNRRVNLRVVTHAQNQQNQTPQVGCSSRYRGVVWHKARGKWWARCKHQGRQYSAGYFADEDEAGQAAADIRRRILPFSRL